MKPIILAGQERAAIMLENIRSKVGEKRVQLAVVQVGKNTVSSSYVEKKRQAASACGITFLSYRIGAGISQKKLKTQITRLAQNPVISGIVVQLPLPAKFNAQEILDCIPPEKDPDLLSSAAFGKFAMKHSLILPPTVAAVAELLRAYDISLRGKRVALLGTGRLVGLPLMIWLSRQGVNLAVINSKTKNPAQLTRQANIVLSGVGKAKLVKSSMIKQGAVVIDLGTSVEEGKAAGDVDFKNVAKKAKAITPVPGGAGPLTVSCLLNNLVTLWIGKL